MADPAVPQVPQKKSAAKKPVLAPIGNKRAREREHARQRGHVWYFTGKPCVRGHIAPRYVATMWCMECKRLKAQEYNRAAQPAPTRAQPVACECCGEPSPRGVLDLDHDHETGAFRGWLCNKCNRSIGALGDTIEAIERVLRYLRRAQQ